mgnify:CR=1 FL=1
MCPSVPVRRALLGEPVVVGLVLLAPPGGARNTAGEAIVVRDYIVATGADDVLAVLERARATDTSDGNEAIEVLGTQFEEDHQEMVIIRDVPFYSICEHHLLPFFGSAHLGYVPRGKVVGGSSAVQPASSPKAPRIISPRRRSP